MSIVGPVGTSGSTVTCSLLCDTLRKVTPKAATIPENSIIRVAGTVHALNADNLVDGVTGTAEAHPTVLAFDADGRYIGHSDAEDSSEDEAAGYVDIIVHQEQLGPGKQTAFLQIAPEKPTCLSYALQNAANGTQAVWVGDVGRACGQEWYYSNARIGNGAPDCTWVDTAIQLQLISVTNTTTDADLDPKKHCSEKSPLIRAEFSYEDAQAPSKDAALFNGEGHGQSLRKKHSQIPRSRRDSFSHLVASPQAHHSATGLCDSDSSLGPDLISFSERRFCDMESKVHYPFCGEGQEHECFDGKTLSIVTRKRSVAKTYSGVIMWDEIGCPWNFPTCGSGCPRSWHLCTTVYGLGDIKGSIYDDPRPPPPKPKPWRPPMVYTPPDPSYDF